MIASHPKITGWQQIVGHEWAVEILSAAIYHERIGHAYLITGPAQIGKTTLARLFAQALNCTHEEVAQRPCGQCRSCTLIARDHHPDVRVVLGEVSGRGRMTLKIDQIRELQQALSLTATEAHYKIAILKRFDSATIGAANAFLKTLEEPPSNVILILTAADSDTLLPTIRSRCRTIPLRPLPFALVQDALQTRWAIPSERAEHLAHLADGRLGWAVNAAANTAPLEERESHIVALHTALQGNRAQRFQQADKLANDAEALPDLLRTWLSWWRDLVLLSWGNNKTARLTNIDEQTTLMRLLDKWSPPQILACLQRTNDALWQLERNANTRLVVENLLLTYPLMRP
ncbi:MAG: DNA polymerase III subunit delta' [Chloroflexi bacterium]|nr:DNA polymerase III subunit delta' [Chloroflexota bacterium]